MQTDSPALVRGVRSPNDPERAMRLVLEQLTHRVGIEFEAAARMIASAVALAPSEQARSVLTAVQIALESFLCVHRVLQVPEGQGRVDGRAFLAQLCAGISRSRLNYRGIRLDPPQSQLEIVADQCWRLGLIVFELIVKAAGHHFANSPGHISVSVERRGALISCHVQDNGVPCEDEFEDRGTRIMHAIAHELHGQIEQYRHGKVCVATVTFPAARASEAEVSENRLHDELRRAPLPLQWEVSNESASELRSAHPAAIHLGSADLHD